jgi:hypothetical protein
VDPAVYRAHTESAGVVPIAAGEVSREKSRTETAPRPGYLRWVWDEAAVESRTKANRVSKLIRHDKGAAEPFISCCLASNTVFRHLSGTNCPAGIGQKSLF